MLRDAAALAATDAAPSAPPGLCSFGFNERETVAINGAHNLGRAHPQFTGFSGQWVRDNDQLSGCEWGRLVEQGHILAAH